MGLPKKLAQPTTLMLAKKKPVVSGVPVSVAQYCSPPRNVYGLPLSPLLLGVSSSPTSEIRRLRLWRLTNQRDVLNHNAVHRHRNSDQIVCRRWHKNVQCVGIQFSEVAILKRLTNQRIWAQSKCDIIRENKVGFADLCQARSQHGKDCRERENNVFHERKC